MDGHWVQSSNCKSAWLVRLKTATDPDNGSCDIPNPSDQYWAMYETEAEAVERARELDRAEMVVNGTAVKPFAQGLEAATTFPEYALRDWLLDCDIPPPDGHTLTDWRVWWQHIRGADRSLTREQFRHVLAALNQLPLYLYEVVPVPRADQEPLQAVGYAVVRRDWVYNDVGFDGDNTPIILHRTRAAAEQEADRRATVDDRYRGPLSVDGICQWQHGATDYVVVELPLSPEG